MSISGSPISNTSEGPQSPKIGAGGGGSDDQAMSETELEQKRQALLAQLELAQEPIDD